MKTLSCIALALALALCSCDRQETWTTESGIRITEIAEGDGPSPAVGEAVSIRYTARHLDGDVFEGTPPDGEPARFIVGRGQLLPGFEEGLSTMRKGGKRIVVIPPELAYGKGGRPPLVPPDTWIELELELVEIEPGPPPIQPWSDAGREIIALDNGLQFVDFEIGDGEFPVFGGRIVVHYSGFLGDGTLFDSSYYRGAPVELEMSAKKLIPGWAQALLSMREGGKRKLIIPPSLGYGSEGFPGKVPPDATLIYDIELLKVEPPHEHPH